MSTIIVGYVPTPTGETALQAAAHEARTHGDQLLVLNVHRHDAPVHADALDDADRRRVRDMLADSAAEVDFVEVEDDSDVAHAILSAAEEHDARLIVLGLRRRSRVGKLLLGSDAQRIIMQAECNVLCVRR